VPGGGKIVFDSALGLTISGSIVIVALIAGFIGLPWFIVALVTVPIVVFAAIGIAAGSEIHDINSNRDWFESSNYNTSSDVRTYVDHANHFHNGSGFCPVSAGTHALGPGADVWDVCGKDLQWFAGLWNSTAGACDDIFPVRFNYTFSVPNSNFPFSYNRTYTNGSFITWSDLYNYASVSGCYGSAFDGASLLKAESRRDLCLVEVASVTECAPGWNRERLQDTICSQFTECKANFEDQTQRWAKFGGVNVTNPGDWQRFQLPARWNELDDLADYWAGEYRADLVDRLLSTPAVWVTINAALLAVALSGWGMIVFGVGASFIGRRREEQPGVLPAVSPPVLSPVPLVAHDSV
jgi:hypothetical protein